MLLNELRTSFNAPVVPLDDADEKDVFRIVILLLSSKRPKPTTLLIVNPSIMMSDLFIRDKAIVLRLEIDAVSSAWLLIVIGLSIVPETLGLICP